MAKDVKEVTSVQELQAVTLERYAYRSSASQWRQKIRDAMLGKVVKDKGGTVARIFDVDDACRVTGVNPLHKVQVNRLVQALTRPGYGFRRVRLDGKAYIAQFDGEDGIPQHLM
jgi:hypothetical protein